MMKRHSRFSSFRLILTACLCCTVFLSGCGSGKNVDVPHENNITPSGSSSSAGNNAGPAVSEGPEKPENTVSSSGSSAVTAEPEKGSGPEGFWYEQIPDGGTLTVTDRMLLYEHANFSDDVSYKKGEESGGKIELIPDEEWWYYIDIFYDIASDTISGHDLPHTDGDGGYHLYTFARTPYVAPPEPVYGERIDNSDPDAPKEFTNVSIRSLTLDVVEPSRPNGDMAPEQPDAGEYSYKLSVKEDGTGILSSDFCRDITVSEEQLKELADLFTDSALPSLNGIDIITEEMPEDTQRYELAMEFDNGESFYSRANGKDVSVEWYIDGYSFHQYLFFLFLDAGYNYWSGEFHSTEPMKRIGFAEGESGDYSIQVEGIRMERNGTVYDYNVHSEYPVFTGEGNVSTALMETLQRISEQYKAQAQADLEENDTEMEKIDRSVWEKEDHRYAYSFYAVERSSVKKNMFTMFVSEGHASSMGVGRYGYGYYPYYYFCIDDESGELLSVNDLFTDNEQLLNAVVEALCEDYRYSPDFQEYFSSDSYRQMLSAALDTPGPEGGISMQPGYDCLGLIFPNELSRKGDYSMTIDLYYDRFQDLLNDRYCSVY